jgi:hypothetical protein
VAWVNRVGQLHYFVQSDLVRQRFGEVDTPTIKSILIFRNKTTAHRAIDDPRKDDTEHLKTIHALSLAGFSRFWTPKTRPARQVSHDRPQATHFLAFQTQSPGGVAHNLVIERDHRKVMLEGYAAFAATLGDRRYQL